MRALGTGDAVTPPFAVPEEPRAFARDVDVRAARLHALPMTTRFHGTTVREGLLRRPLKSLTLGLAQRAASGCLASV